MSTELPVFPLLYSHIDSMGNTQTPFYMCLALEVCPENMYTLIKCCILGVHNVWLVRELFVWQLGGSLPLCKLWQPPCAYLTLPPTPQYLNHPKSNHKPTLNLVLNFH